MPKSPWGMTLEVCLLSDKKIIVSNVSAKNNSMIS